MFAWVVDTRASASLHKALGTPATPTLSEEHDLPMQVETTV